MAIYVSGGLKWLVEQSTFTLTMTMVGLGGVGFFQAGTLVPVIPEVMEAVQAELNEDFIDNHVNAHGKDVFDGKTLSPSLRRQQTIDDLLA